MGAINVVLAANCVFMKGDSRRVCQRLSAAGECIVAKISESFIEQLKDANPIDEVISTYVTLKRRGRNLTGLCPFHSEKTPSFTVYPMDASPHYHCFGCGSGGDVITFVRNIENLEYIEALKFLCTRAGMTLPEITGEDQTGKIKARVLELNRETARYFHHCLMSDVGREGLAYLTGRGLTIKTIKSFGLGYSPDSWDSLRNHMAGKGFTQEEMLAAAVVAQGRNGSVYDSFRGRVIFPIIDLRGNVIGFGGRAMSDHGPKYLNSGDTPVFKKSRNLFALNFAKSTKSDTLILAEGYMDVIAIHQAGFDNAVATLGTALTPEQSRLLSQYTKRVAIAYDSDAAGQAATKRAINLLGEIDIAVSVLEIQGAKDPDEYIKKFGPERFGNLITGGKGAISFEIDKLKTSYDLNSPEGKSAFLGEFCKFMAGISNELQRDVYVSQISSELEVGKEALRLTVDSIRKKRRLANEKKAAHNLKVYAQDKLGIGGNSKTGGSLAGYVAEEKLLTLLMKNPDSYEMVNKLLTPDDFVSLEHREIYTVITRRLAESGSTELIHMADQLSPKLMGKLTQLMVSGREIQFHVGQAEEYCMAIRSQKDVKTTDEVKQMSPDEYAAYITSLKAKKK